MLFVQTSRFNSSSAQLILFLYIKKEGFSFIYKIDFILNLIFFFHNRDKLLFDNLLT